MKKDSIFFSVILPIYNTPAAYFRICMESVLKQTFGAFEAILVDDGSGDEVKNICDAYAGQDSRVRVIHKENGGVSEARNTGTDAARGEWIIYLDPDDWWEPNTLELLRERLEGSTSQILFFSYFDYFEERKQEIPRSFYRGESVLYQELSPRQLENVQMGILDESIRGMNFTGSCWMYALNRCFLQNLGLRFKPGMKALEDILFNMNLLEAAERAAVLNVPLYHYRHHKTSICNRFNQEMTEILEEANQQIGIYCETKAPQYRETFQFFLMYNYVKVMRLYFLNQGYTRNGRERKRQWMKFLKESPSCTLLEKADWKMLFRKRKIFGILHFLTFRLPCFRCVKVLFHLYFRFKKEKG